MIISKIYKEIIHINIKIIINFKRGKGPEYIDF